MDFGHFTRTLHLSKCVVLVTWPIQPIALSKWQNNTSSAFASGGKIGSALLNFGNAKKLCLFCLMRQQHYWNYFAFNQSYLAKGKTAPVVLLPCIVRQNKNIWIGLMIFKNFADQDWIGFNFIGSGPDSDWKISQSAHLCHLANLWNRITTKIFDIFRIIASK